MSMIAKIVYEKEIHLYRGEIGFTLLKRHCQNVFKAIPKNFEFFYFDTDGDKITVNSQQDLDIIFENQTQNGIKKIYIQEIDSEFEELQDKQNPEICEVLTPQNYCPLSRYDPNIKTVNIVKDQISKQQEQKIKRQAKMYLLELEDNIIDKLIQQEEKLVKEQVAKCLSMEIQNNVVEKVIKTEEKLIKGEVYLQMEEMMQNCAFKLSEQVEQSSAYCKKEVGIQNHETIILSSNLSRNQALIDRLVEQKLNKMLPGLIKQVVRTVEARLVINGCYNCQRKESDKEFNNAIRNSIMRKLKKNYHEC